MNRATKVDAWVGAAEHHRDVGNAVDVVNERIAATALFHDPTVVTCNVRDFEHSGFMPFSLWSR